MLPYSIPTSTQVVSGKNKIEYLNLRSDRQGGGGIFLLKFSKESVFCNAVVQKRLSENCSAWQVPHCNMTR